MFQPDGYEQTYVRLCYLPERKCIMNIIKVKSKKLSKVGDFSIMVVGMQKWQRKKRIRYLIGTSL